MPNLPILNEHESEDTVGAAARDRRPRPRRRVQLADHPRRHPRRRRARERRQATVWYASGRRGVSSLTFRGREAKGAYTGFTDRPAYANAREIAADLMAAYVDGKVDRVEIFYNGYVSPLTQEVTRETLLPLQQATILEDGDEDTLGGRAGGRRGATRLAASTRSSSTSPTPRRSSSAWSPTTSRSRSTARCWSPPRPSTARA